MPCQECKIGFVENHLVPGSVDLTGHAFQVAGLARTILFVRYSFKNVGGSGGTYLPGQQGLQALISEMTSTAFLLSKQWG